MVGLVMTCPRCWGKKSDPLNAGNACLGCTGTGFASDSQLSAHFLLSEFLISQTAIRRGIPNDPPPGVLSCLGGLAQVLEPIRLQAGTLHVDSGYRCVSLNLAVGGAMSSAHLTGCAADLVPLAISKIGLFNLVVASKLPFDQVIWEYGSWVHVGVLGPGGCQRREQLMIFPGTGYLPFNMQDPRVQG
jgi:hypothetical protein